MTRAPRHRLPDWPKRLVAYFAAHEAVPFAWGANDCCGFAAGDVAAITGEDALGCAWRTVDEAVQQLRCERGLVAAVTRRLGPPLPTPALAQRGDVLLVVAPVDGRTRFLAVCDSDRWAAPGPEGLLRGPIGEARLAWPVGRAG